LLAILRASFLLSSLAAYPIGLSRAAFAIIAERAGRKAMEWFKQKTSIAGVQVSNWMIVLGAIIIVLLIFQNFH